jgi:hypothetical protein
LGLINQNDVTKLKQYDLLSWWVLHIYVNVYHVVCIYIIWVVLKTWDPQNTIGFNTKSWSLMTWMMTGGTSTPMILEFRKPQCMYMYSYLIL